MATSVPPKAVGSILADRAVADSDAFEKFAQHYMSIILSKKKCNQKLLQRTGIRRSERLIAKRKIIDENVCKKKIKTKNPPSNLKAKRRINFNKIRITPPVNIIQISDDDDMEIIEPVPEPAATHNEIEIDLNNNQEVVPIEVDSSSDEEDDQNEWKGSQLIEHEGGRQVFHSGGSSNQAEGNHFHNPYAQSLYETSPYYPPYHQTIEQDMTSSSSIRSTSTTIGYYSHSHNIMHSHTVYTPNREPFTPIGSMPNCYQEMPMTGAAPYSNLYSYNESQQRMTPSTPLPLLLPEQAAHSFAEELPTNSAHCVFQVNQLTALTTINDRPTRTGIFSIFFGNNQHAYISGHMFFNSEEDNFQFEEHFFNQSHMSNGVPYQNFDRNYDQHRVNQPQSNQTSADEQPVPVNDEDESATIVNSVSNNPQRPQRGQCNMERFLPHRNVQSDSKYETIEILDSSDDECADDTVSEMTFPAARAATDNPRLNLMSFMAMVSNGELSLTVAERGRIDALRHHPTNANIRMRIDIQENRIDDHFSSHQSDSRSMQWDNLGYSHDFPTVTYNVLYGPNPGEEAVMFNSVLFVNENQQCFYRYIPWLLGLWHQRNFISWVVDFEEIP